MFSWFRQTGSNKSKLDDWNINGIDGFEKIQNDDSTQYVSEGADKVIYFSILAISGKDVFGIGNPAEPIVKEEAGLCQVKGTRKHKNTILICLITLKNADDVGWAKNFLLAISHKDAL